MKKADLSQVAITELKDKLKDERNSLDKMCFTHTISPVENPKRIPLAKKNCCTFIN